MWATPAPAGSLHGVPSDSEARDYLRRNRSSWNAAAAEYVDPAIRNWSRDEPEWGVFGVPDSLVGAFPTDVEGKDAIELGCGTGYISAWLARRGALPVGIDLTEGQLATARAMQERFDLRFPLVQGDAEILPFPDESFDLAISEYGASLWCDPYRWVPEAARVLRPGGELTFLTNGTILMLTVPDSDAEGPADERLKRDYFGMHRFEWPDDEGVEFHIGYGDWIRLFRDYRFEVRDLIEVRPHEDATTRYPFVTPEWARRWPAEEIWKATKLG